MARTPRCQGLQLALWVVLASHVLLQAQTTETYKPKLRQPGKDVIWVPTPQALVDTMLDMAKVTPEDLVMDLGSGDGTIVITAAKRGARAIGIEYNPDLVLLSRNVAAAQGVGERATFMQADLFTVDLSNATVVTMFLLQSINLKLRPTLLELKPGTRIVSNSFDMGEWTPDEKKMIGPAGCFNRCTAMLWIVPAKAQGTWKTSQGLLRACNKTPKLDPRRRGSVNGVWPPRCFQICCGILSNRSCRFHPIDQKADDRACRIARV
jgi:SAM-dependent methyltransferase